MQYVMLCNQMLPWWRWVVTVSLTITLLLSTGLLNAQDEPEPTDTDLTERYADLEFSRMEDGGFVLGSPDTPLTIVEFSDFMCPHCQNYETTIAQLIENYVLTGKARYEYRMFPIVHPTYSILTAQVAECAGTLQPGAFWPARDLIYQMATNQQISDDLANVVAESLGLNGEALTSCMYDARQYAVDSELASEMGINGTPAVMVRLDSGDLEWIVFDEQTFNRGGAPFEVVEALIQGDELASTAPPPHLLNDLLLPDDSLVRGEICDGTPCWKGIQIGETSWDDALEIIQNDPAFANVQIQNDPNSDSVQVIWGPVDGQVCCQLFSEDGESVDVILLQTTPLLSLGEVIEKYGEPEYVIGNSATSKQAIANLFYPDVPMVVYVFITGMQTGEIDETSEVIGVLYLTSDIMNLILGDSNVYAWQGYQPYLVYIESEFAEIQ